MKNKSNNSSLILWIFALLILVGAFAFAARPSWSTMTNLINNTKALKNLQTPNNFSWFKIDTTKWNNLMEYLDQFSWYIAEYESIKELPVWIVLPFDSSRGCPEGGERRVYSPAIWRFIKWTSVAQEIGTYTWDASNWTWNNEYWILLYRFECLVKMPPDDIILQNQSGRSVIQCRFVFSVERVAQAFLIVFFILLTVLGRRAAP